VLDNSWNLASSLIVDGRLTAESIVASSDFDQGSNDLALAIAELGNNEFAKDISDINADIGNSLSDLSDNIDHQNTIETLLLDQRNAISSVSIDEEVADLMQFQRSFQASSRVLNTLDKMLELVVMGLLK
jgi:flagellar hook-associated protein 1 FlgK